MKLQIVNRASRKVVFESDAASFSACVKAAIEAGADLRYADLRFADLRYADLSYADLRYADLSYADLRSANLGYANLSYADLRYANLPAPTSVLLAAWGSVEAQLTADLMLWDSQNHPDPEAFDRWAKGGPCPYAEAKVQRACNFTESKEQWGKGAVRRPYDLMIELFKEKEIKF